MRDDIIQTINFYKGNTKKIAIYAISDKGRLKIQELDLEQGGALRYRRLKELNNKNEGIYFAPEDDYCNMLFLDDPTHLEGLPRGTIVIETSPNKYQAHIPFTGPSQSKQLRTEFQRQLCHIYRADKGAVYANHLRRLPGFHNQKYPDRPLVKILYSVEDGEYLTLEKLTNMMDIDKSFNLSDPDTLKTSKERFATLSNGGVPPKPPRRRHSPPPSLTGGKSWVDFYDDGDRSRTDMRYVLYLLRMGANEEEIRDKLLQESEDIMERKKGHLEDYLRRTIKKANEYIS